MYAVDDHPLHTSHTLHQTMLSSSLLGRVRGKWNGVCSSRKLRSSERVKE